MGVNSQRKLFEFFPFIVDLISEGFVVQGSKQDPEKLFLFINWWKTMKMYPYWAFTTGRCEAVPVL